jgi:hypothetical protein
MKPSRCPEFSARIARNAAHHQEETHILVVDPWANGYMMEKTHAGHGRRCVEDEESMAWAGWSRPWTATGS